MEKAMQKTKMELTFDILGSEKHHTEKTFGFQLNTTM